MEKIYLDNSAATKVDPKVVKAIIPYLLEKYGNASSPHQLGQEAKRVLEESRAVIAKKIHAKPEEIIFTSGGTESNNLAIKGTAFANKGNHIITCQTEHDCVLNSCKFLEEHGYSVTYLPVNEHGIVNPKDVEKAIREDTILVSIMQGNNEIGTIQPIEEIGKLCRKKEVYFHTDACQSFCKVPLNVKKQNLDLVTLNAHKMHGPKGVGALFVRTGVKIKALESGGGHENNLRSGTENIPGIAGFAESVKQFKKRDIKNMTKLRDRLINGILEKVPDVKLNGPIENRLCNNVNFSFKYIEGEALGGYLDAKGICTATGSACSSASLKPSHVLTAIGLSPEQAHGSVRITLGKFNTAEEIETVLDILPKMVEKLRKISPFGRKK